MILHLLRMRINVNRKVYNDRENVSATATLIHDQLPSDSYDTFPQNRLVSLAHNTGK